ncbi:MAG TPA: cyclase family protein [Syntrophales bacterium]|nr:cyclase family protein [Syntrophales bacterium]
MKIPPGDMRVIWLSHVIEETTPLYGGKRDISIRTIKSINKGDAYNETSISMPSHTGTHVDAPRHFLEKGMTVSDYPPAAWIFHHPCLVEVEVPPTMLIRPEDIIGKVQWSEETDLLLVKTGFERRRSEEVYWREGPGLSSSFAVYIMRMMPHLKAVGIDFISISTLTDRDEGRQVHHLLLEKGIRIIEDLSLEGIRDRARIRCVIVLPLRMVGGDGAPCTVLAWIDD